MDNQAIAQQYKKRNGNWITDGKDQQPNGQINLVALAMNKQKESLCLVTLQGGKRSIQFPDLSSDEVSSDNKVSRKHLEVGFIKVCPPT